MTPVDTITATTTHLGHFQSVEAVIVQRLNVPDLVVIDQLNQQQQLLLGSHTRGSGRPGEVPNTTAAQNINSNPSSQPEAASLINSQDLSSSSIGSEQPQITFECLISYDKRKDKNLVVKWHYDDREEPIYQWIPERNKRSIAPQYRAYIVPIVSSPQQQLSLLSSSSSSSGGGGGADLQQQQAGGLSGIASSTQATNVNLTAAAANQTQLLEAGFKLIRPTKELGAPPRTFRFNASRIDIGAQLASQRERLIQLSQPALLNQVSSSSLSSNSNNNNYNNQLPLAYRMKGFESQLGQQPTTISPQMYSTIDYVNVNQQRTRQQQQQASFPVGSWLTSSPALSSQTATGGHHLSSGPSQAYATATATRQTTQQQQQQQQQQLFNSNKNTGNNNNNNGVKLVCDIDQVFPVPEVSIYRLGKLDGSHPDKLARLDRKIERNPLTGLYHVQVISILEDDELLMKYGQNEPVYFECLIALTNLELSKYADNKRSIIYKPGKLV